MESTGTGRARLPGSPMQRKADNLKRSATILNEEYGGDIPSSVDDLVRNYESLP